MHNNIKRITVSAFLVALGVIFSRLISIPIDLGGAYSFNLGLGMLPILLICVLYGPVYGSLGALCWDLLGAIIFPKGAFVVWFTLAAGVLGFITGAFFSKIETKQVHDEKLGYGPVWTVYHSAKPATMKRVFLAVLCGEFIYSVVLNTLLITLLYGVPVKVLLPPRIIENVIMVFVNSALILLLIKQLSPTGLIPAHLHKDKENKRKPEEVPQLLEEDGKNVSAQPEVISPSEPKLSDMLGLIGGHICNNNFAKAKSFYDEVLLQYKKSPESFTQNQRKELSEYRRILSENLPADLFIVVDEAFDVDAELEMLDAALANGETERAKTILSGLKKYFSENRSMFSESQKERLRSFNAALSKQDSE